MSCGLCGDTPPQTVPPRFSAVGDSSAFASCGDLGCTEYRIRLDYLEEVSNGTAVGVTITRSDDDFIEDPVVLIEVNGEQAMQPIQQTIPAGGLEAEYIVDAQFGDTVWVEIQSSTGVGGLVAGVDGVVGGPAPPPGEGGSVRNVALALGTAAVVGFAAWKVIR